MYLAPHQAEEQCHSPEPGPAWPCPALPCPALPRPAPLCPQPWAVSSLPTHGAELLSSPVTSSSRDGGQGRWREGGRLLNQEMDFLQPTGCCQIPCFRNGFQPGSPAPRPPSRPLFLTSRNFSEILLKSSSASPSRLQVNVQSAWWGSGHLAHLALHMLPC